MKGAISSKKLEEILALKTKTIRIYLCRPELNHIVFVKNIFYNISEEDIEILRTISAKGKKYKAKIQESNNKQDLLKYTDNQLENIKFRLKTDMELKQSQLMKIEKELEQRNKKRRKGKTK